MTATCSVCGQSCGPAVQGAIVSHFACAYGATKAARTKTRAWFSKMCPRRVLPEYTVEQIHALTQGGEWPPEEDR